MIGPALLLMAAQPLPSAPLPTAIPVAAPALFAPPTNRPMVYRVTTRRLARDGSMASYTLVYDLQWSRVGRGVQLAATLRAIESDAAPAVVRAVTAMLAPLVGQPVTYLIAPDGSDITLVDPDALWQQVLGRAHDLGASAARGEARQMAGLLAALPPAEREKLATADVRALVAAANPAIEHGSPGRSIEPAGTLRTVTQSEPAATKAGDGWAAADRVRYRMDDRHGDRACRKRAPPDVDCRRRSRRTHARRGAHPHSRCGELGERYHNTRQQSRGRVDFSCIRRHWPASKRRFVRSGQAA